MQEFLLQRLAEGQDEAFGYTEFFNMLQTGFSCVMSAVGVVAQNWPLFGFIFAPFVVVCLIAVVRKLKG